MLVATGCGWSGGTTWWLPVLSDWLDLVTWLPRKLGVGDLFDCEASGEKFVSVDEICDDILFPNED